MRKNNKMKKNNFRKILSILLGITIIVSVFVPTQIFAANAAVAISGPTSVATGEENTFAVKLTGNPGFSGFNITVGFDSNMFEFVKTTDGTYTFTKDVNPATDSVVVGAMNSDNLLGDGTLINVVLKTKANAKGSSSINIKVNELFDADMNDISSTATSLNVRVKEEPTPTENYTVKFNSNGGSNVSDQTVVSGGKATKPNDPTKDGYKFGGWYSNAELTKVYDFSSKVTANITLYAKWIENSAPVSSATVAVRGPASVNSGSNADFSVMLTGNPGFAGFKITLSYDINKFEFVKASNGSYSCTYDLPEKDTTGKLVIAAMNSEDLKNNGTLANVTLKAKKGVSGDSTISVKVDELFNADMSDITATTKDFSTLIKSSTATITETSTEPTTETTTETTTDYHKSSGGGDGTAGKIIYRNTTTESTSESTTEATTEQYTEVTTIANDVSVIIGSKSVKIGDKAYDIDVAPYMQSSSRSTLVPLRFVAFAI